MSGKILWICYLVEVLGNLFSVRRVQNHDFFFAIILFLYPSTSTSMYTGRVISPDTRIQPGKVAAVLITNGATSTSYSKLQFQNKPFCRTSQLVKGSQHILFIGCWPCAANC